MLTGCAPSHGDQCLLWPISPGSSVICAPSRSVLDRELTRRSPDLTLLALERMHMIDVMNSWSHGTHASYQSKLRVIRAFETQFGLPVLQNTPVPRPPSSPAIPLTWAQQYYSDLHLGATVLTY